MPERPPLEQKTPANPWERLLHHKTYEVRIDDLMITVHDGVFTPDLLIIYSPISLYLTKFGMLQQKPPPCLIPFWSKQELHYNPLGAFLFHGARLLKRNVHKSKCHLGNMVFLSPANKKNMVDIHGIFTHSNVFDL